MTWHVSPEEWLLDFTVIPRGRARGGEGRDVIDDRLKIRQQLTDPLAALAHLLELIRDRRLSDLLPFGAAPNETGDADNRSAP